jgi:FtsP/CotA-like multicopper oxidase with cupredoxin domain
MINGRGYPDTVDTGFTGPPTPAGDATQVEHSLVEATAGEKILLRISNISITRYFTLQSSGIPMTVVGRDARLLRGPDPDGDGPLVGKNLYYQTNSVTLGGGETNDVILDTAGIAPGTYFLYTTNLNHLSNGEDQFGGMMTEIRIY